MKSVVCFFALVAAVYCADSPKHTPPKVQVYTRHPAEYGKENILICSASLFFPPDITIQLMRNGVELPDSKESDLVFKDDWRFHVTKHTVITPVSGEDYSCKITHGTNVNNYAWEPNM